MFIFILFSYNNIQINLQIQTTNLSSELTFKDQASTLIKNN